MRAISFIDLILLVRSELGNVDLAVGGRGTLGLGLLSCALISVGSVRKHVLGARGIEVDALLLCKRGERRVAHDARTGNGFNLTARCGSSRISGVFRCSSLRRDVLLEVFLVPVEVFRARQGVLKQNEDGEEHLRGHLCVDALEFLQVDPPLATEHLVEKILDLRLILQSVKEYLAEKDKKEVKLTLSM